MFKFAGEECCLHFGPFFVIFFFLLLIFGSKSLLNFRLHLIHMIGEYQQTLKSTFS